MKTILTFFASGVVAANAAIIVGLSETDPSVIFNESGVANQTSAPGNNAVGISMNVTFTPSAVDIGQITNAVNLLEIGGNANGTGLYLLGGEVHFLSKMQGTAANVFSSTNDLDFASGNNMVTIKSSFGALSAGTEYSVGVLYDPLGAASLTLAIQPTGGALAQQTESLSGVGTKNNWSGNDTITSFTGPGNAGAGTTVAGNVFQEGLTTMKALDGTAGQALIWNAQGSLVPEPSNVALVGLSALLMLKRRR